MLVYCPAPAISTVLVIALSPMYAKHINPKIIHLYLDIFAPLNGEGRALPDTLLLF
jgi:hypothetical protein